MTKLLRFGFEIGISSAPITQKLKATTRTDENKLVISLAHRLRGARQTTCAVHRKLVESLPMTGSNQDSALNKFDVLPAPFALRNFVSQSACDISRANLSMRLNFGYCPIRLHLTHDKRQRDLCSQSYRSVSAVTHMSKYKQANRRRPICVLARLVDFGKRLRQSSTLRLGDFL